MTFLASSAASLWSQVQTWTNRANQAWGASRVWNSGQSFEVDRNAAYDGGSWGSGNLWSTDCHNDPNVWTTRYNTGYTDGQAAYTPPSSVLNWNGTFVTGTCPASSSVVPTVSGSGSLGINGSGSQTLSITKTGRYVIYAHCSTSENEWGNNSSWRLDIITSAGTTTGQNAHQVSGPYGGGNQGNGPQGAALGHAVWTGTLSAGQTIQFRLYQQGGGYTANYPTGGGNQIYIEFIPTPSYPH